MDIVRGNARDGNFDDDFVGIKCSDRLKDWLSETRSPENEIVAIQQSLSSYQNLLQEIQDHLEKKLYYELMLSSIGFMQSKDLDPKTVVSFFTNVVSPLKRLIDPEQFLQTLKITASALEPSESLFLLRIYKDDMNTFPLNILYLSTNAFFCSRGKLYRDAEKYLDQASVLISSRVGVQPHVHAEFHRSHAELAKAQKKFSEFYRHAVIYLAYTPTASIAEEERTPLAVEVSVSSLVAKDVFNFGELLQHALIKSSLENNEEYAWLFSLLTAFHSGSIAQFDSILITFNTQIKQSQLKDHLDEMQKKISIAAFLRLALERSAAGLVGGESFDSSSLSRIPSFEGDNDDKDMSMTRKLSFECISQHCRVPVDEVEMLCMTTMSKNLIRLRIDQVNQCIQILWVKPALLLDRQSLSYLHDRIKRWSLAAEQQLRLLQHQTTELLGS